MDIYDQHEQGERVRSWLKDNGGAIITGIVLGLGAIFGYHQWQTYKVRQAHEAAELYSRTQAPRLAATTDPAVSPADMPAADAARSQLRSGYARSGYAVLAAFEQAAAQLEADDVESARASLTWARDNTDEAELKALAGVRIAQLELAAGKPDDALKALGSNTDDSFAALRSELRGDAYAALGRNDEARTAYEAAKAVEGSDTARLDMKLADYAAAGTSTVEEGA